MQNKYVHQIIQLLLALLIGVLGTLTVIRIQENNKLIRTRYQDWAKLNVILNMIEENYVDTLNRTGMTDAAVTAALAQLDPHSMYLPPVDHEASVQELAGNFEGIGIQFNVPADTAIVLEVIAGGPSEKVGLQIGDRILKVDDVVIAGVNFPQDSIVAHIKGPAGTKVLITVKRGREIIPFEIIRAKIPLHSVDAWFMLDDTTGYIRLSKFSRTTYEEVKEASAKLLQEGMTRLVFDLRDNSGGYLDQALYLTNEFLARGDTIVYMEGRSRQREVYRADGHGKLQDIGLSVLISENSASSSEIFAGAIQDNDRGVLVGRRSYGKGLVQEDFPFRDGSGLRLTVARYYTPAGRCIQKPYADYEYDIYNRYLGGEIFSADAVKLDSSDVHTTRGGRTVFGGGGIMPDVYVPMDTTLATKYFTACNRKATMMRFASYIFDNYSREIRAIDSYTAMDAFFARIGIDGRFRSYAGSVDGIKPESEAEWQETLPYLAPQIRALTARYSQLGENAFYKYYLPVDDMVEVAMNSPFAPTGL